MNVKAVLFDLDGTLLPMEQEIFVKKYFGLLASKLAPHGYDPKQLVDAVLSGTAAMIANNGRKSNEAVFWDDFAARYGQKATEDIPLFDEFYKNEFEGARTVCGYNPQAAEAVARIKSMGFRVALATNPIFPSAATESRIHWAGLSKADFEFYTAYENSCYSKPNPEYYRETAEKLGLKPQECLMVGNDVTEDMAAQITGMKVFLLTDCLINKERQDISIYPNGGFAGLLEYVGKLVD